MERLTHSLKVLWRSERLLVGSDLGLMTKKIQINAMAGLMALFGLVMLGIAAYFALVPVMGQALAALTIGLITLVLATILFLFSSSRKPSPEVTMIREMRNMALKDIEDEVGQVEADITALKGEVVNFVRRPADALVPGLIGPLVNAIVRGIVSARK